MDVDGFAHRWRAVLLLVLFALAACTVLAEEGVLVLAVMDTEQHPFANVQIGAAGDGGSPQFTDQNGKARLKLAPNTKPAAWVTLQLMGAPNGLDLAFISPYDGRVRVPPFDNEQDNYDPIVLAKHGDKAILESGSGMLAIHTNVNHSVAAQKKKVSPHASRNRSNYPSPFNYGIPHLLTVALKTATPRAEPSDASPTDEELQKVALAAVAQKFGLSVAEIKAAIENWGGDALVWKLILLTATIEAGGTDPFPAIHATSKDLYFGIASWSLSECSLQPLLLKFRERDDKRFAEIVGADTEWLSKTISGPCAVSSPAALKRMLDDSGHLQPIWRDRFRRLGYEHSFQRVQVDQMMSSMRSAQAAAAAFGLQSEEALAFCYGVTEAQGVNAIVRPRQNLSRDVAAFQQYFGRQPDEQEKLLMLANRVIQRDKESAPSPIFTASSVARATLFSQGKGMVFGTDYDLEDFGIGLQDVQTGAHVPIANDPAILHLLKDGWIPSGGPPPGSASLSPRQLNDAAAADKTPAISTPASPALSTTGQISLAKFDAAGEKQLVELTNQERTSHGLPPLAVDQRLTEAARRHTELLAAHETLSHQFEGEPPLDARLANESLPTDQEAENTALNNNVPTAHKALMLDPPHRASILNPNYNVVGVGVIRSGGQVYVTEDFAHLPTEYSEPEADAALQQAIEAYATAHGVPIPERKPQSQLRQMACTMALNDALINKKPAEIPGAQETAVWTTLAPGEIPSSVKGLLSHPLASGYSLGACFAPSVSHPGGVYWVVMIVY
jgi:uncharacterized protein YkwD